MFTGECPGGKRCEWMPGEQSRGESVATKNQGMNMLTVEREVIKMRVLAGITEG